MRSLTYVSAAVRPFRLAELHDLMVTARARNASLDVTGMLLYAGGRFIQTLEGPGDAVDGLFERIALDPRHEQVLRTLREDVGERRFPDWSMGFDYLGDEQSLHTPGFTDFLRAGSTLHEASLRFSRGAVGARLFRDLAY
ncbi:BLUF domain-containing protein [Nocardioides sp. CFH 31398]|uniref:BLUF domain-containing protein n=1 Tax=Nocardioides sp. CFH 31398 TaxID=2919579 RepID=UPI001F05DAC9|nr:BLUF domain-containing protein [Nocardioides sp. CFH 31398]MCH1867119.1 BLUF domain-containing protein [Nocardioides sp. CFH 31398]